MTPTQADREQFEKFVPYWQPDRCTGIFSNVCISRKTGAAQANKLFYQEFVPEGVSFEVEIAATRLTDDEITLLLAVLEQGASHPTHAYQFGANGADGMGTSCLVAGLREPRFPLAGTRPGAGGSRLRLLQHAVEAEGVEHACTCRGPAALSAELTLSFQGPFLVNDASRAKPPTRSKARVRPRCRPRSTTRLERKPSTRPTREGRPHELHAAAPGHGRRMAAILVLPRGPASAH